MDEEESAVFQRALGKRLRLLRVVRELTQEELGQAAGISRSFVSLVEHGSNSLDVVRLMRLAEALGVSLPVLLDVGAPVSDLSEGLPS